MLWDTWDISSLIKDRNHTPWSGSTLSTKVYMVKAMVFPAGHVWMWELDHKKDSAEELMLLNCGAGEDSWESLGLQGDQASQS